MLNVAPRRQIKKASSSIGIKAKKLASLKSQNSEKVIKHAMHATPSPIDFSQSTISEESKCYLDFEDQDEKAREIIFMQIFTILQLAPNKRRKKQLLELKEYFKNLDFFK